MDELVRIEIEVTQEAAAALKDEQRRRSAGRMVSELFSQKQRATMRSDWFSRRSRMMPAKEASRMWRSMQS